MLFPEDVIDPSLYDEIEFLNDLNINGGIDSVELGTEDLESDSLLFTLNKITVNSVFASVGAAVALFTSLITLYSDITDSRLLVDSDAETITDKINRLVNQFSRKAIEKKVRDSAAHVEVPVSLLNQAKSDLIRAGSFSLLVKERQKLTEADGFNVTRVVESLSGCPPFFFDRAIDIALNGVKIPITETFISQTYPNPLRDLGRRLGNKYLQFAIESVEEGTGILLRLEDLLNLCPDEEFHFGNSAHCVFQNGKARFIIDCSNATEGYEPLNTPWCKEWAKVNWGNLVLPTVEEICTDLSIFCEDNGYNLDQLRMILLDVSNAFGKMRIDAESVRYLGVLVHENPELVLARIKCFFGKSEFPYEYNDISKCLEHKSQEIVFGVARVYVDDLAAFSLHTEADRNQEELKQLHTKLFGLRGLNDEKSKNKPSLQGEFIGWYWDLKAGTIRPKDSAVNKLLLLVYVIIDAEAVSWSLLHCQILVSLTIHYSKGLLSMNCFTKPFINMLAGKERRANDQRMVTDAARFAIYIWRSVLLQPAFMAAPISSLSKSSRDQFDYLTINDAEQSLGVGIENSRGDLLAFCSYDLPFSKTHSKFQNVREFMGFILSLLMIHRNFGAPRGTKVKMLTDSISAKTWVEKDRCSSRFANTAFLLYIWTLFLTGYVVVEVKHIPGASDQMRPIDDLSRRRAPTGYDPSLRVEATNSFLDKVFAICGLDLDEEFRPSCAEQHVMLKQIVTLVRSYLADTN